MKRYGSRSQSGSGIGSATRCSVGALALSVALGLAACGGDEQKSAPPAQPKSEAPPAPAPTPAPTPAPAPTPEPAAPIVESGDARVGAPIYASYCATCHGASGGGDGPLSAGLTPQPARHSDGGYMNGLSDEYLTQVIRDGGASVGKSPLMAAWGTTLSDQDIAHVVAFVRSLADPPYRAPSN